MKVILVNRRPFHEQYSVETFFSRVAESMLNRGIEVSTFNVPYLSKGIWPRICNTRSVESLNSDIIHVTGDVNYVALGGKKKNTVLTILDCYTLERLKGIRRAIYKHFWFTLPIRHAAHITTISENAKNELIRFVPELPPAKVTVIPISIAQHFQPAPKPFNTNCPRVLMIGTKPNKNIPNMIRGLKGLDCTAVIIGKLNEEIKHAIRESNVKFENHVDVPDAQILASYQECDIVGFASTYEGFGMPIVEAQSIERVVVTSNCSSMPEIAGDGAILVDPWNVNSIRSGFQSAIHDHQFRESTIVAGRFNRTRFNHDKIVSQYLQLYERMVG